MLVDAAHEDQFDYYPEEYVESGRRIARAMRWTARIAGIIVGTGVPAFFAGRIPDPVADALPPDVGARRRDDRDERAAPSRGQRRVRRPG